MDKSYRKEPFETFKIKASTAKRFRKYAREMGCSQSMTLQLMLEFFEVNGLSPNEQLGPNMHTLEQQLKKRIDALIAIIRSIEKSQTKPTALMLQSLFEAANSETEPKFRERRHPENQGLRFPERNNDDQI